MGKRAYINDGNDNWIPLVSSLPNMAPYATIEYVDNSINAIDLDPYATELYVDSAIDSAKVSASAAAVSYLVDSAPSTLDTLNELSQALNDDANFAGTVTNLLSNKLDSSTASSTYLTQVTASEIYLEQSSASGVYATKVSPSITGTTSIQEILEYVSISASAATGTINYDILTNHAVMYYTSNATGNFAINFRGNSGTSLSSLMSVGQSLTVAFLVKNGSTGYFNNYISVDDQQIVYYWQGGSSPSANTNCTDIYTYTIIKTGTQADSFIVFASQTKFA